MRKLLGIGSIITVLTACSSSEPPLYYWGNYHKNVYQYYTEPGNTSAQKTEILATIQQAKAHHLPVAPGIYGHLGLLELRLGDVAAARAAFKQEATLYPESAQFIDFINRRQQGGK